MRAVVAADVNGACFSHVRLMNKWFSLCSVHFPLFIRVACDALLSPHCPCCVHCYGSITLTSAVKTDKPGGTRSQETLSFFKCCAKVCPFHSPQAEEAGQPEDTRRRRGSQLIQPHGGASS